MNDFEKYAKETLNNHGSLVETDRLWAQIEQNIRPEKRRPKAIWFWLFGVALLAGAGAVWNFGDSAPKSPAKRQTAPEKIAANAAVPERSISENMLPEQNYTTPETASETSKHPVNGHSAWKPAYSAEKRRNGIVRSKQGMPEPKGKQTGRNPAGSPTLPEAAPVTASGEPSVSEKMPETGVTGIPVTYGRSAGSSVQALPQIWEPLHSERKSAMPGMQPTKTGCSEWGRKSAIKPYFGGYGGAQYPVKSLRDKTNEFAELVNKRQETETVLEGLVVGGYFGLRHRNGFSAEAGLEYNRINERFDQANVISDTIGKIGITGIIINAPGDTTFIQDSIFVLQETRTERRIYNHYRFLQIPVGIGFTWNTDSRWSPYLKAGVAINVRFRQKAEMINLKGDPEKYLSEQAAADYPFRSHIGLSPFVNAGLRYQLLDGLALFGELRYVHHTGDVTTDAYPLQQRYKLPGANLGLEWQF